MVRSVSSDRPNVIVIVSDTFRPDHLGVHGRGIARTPELDAFARSAVTLTNVVSSSFPTIPTREDWFTGRFSAPRHGWQDLDPRMPNLPGILRGNGYTTQFLADTTHMLRARYWAAFDAFHFLRGHEGDVPLTRLNDPVRPVQSDRRKTRIEIGNRGDQPAIGDVHAHTNVHRRYEDELHAPMLAETACRWIEDNWRGGPFLLWLDFFDVHEPWFPPEYLLRSYQPRYDGEPMAHPNYHSASAYAPDELANLRARYAAQCTLLSKSVGRVLRLIDDSGLRERSIVVFLSDHGIFLGEHGLTGKSHIDPDVFDVFPFHPEVSRQCWMMSAPGDGGVAPGTALPVLAQAPDLLPTVLDLAGIAPPAGAKFEGISLAPVLRGESTANPRAAAVTSWTLARNRGPLLHCRRPAVTDGEWTLILREVPDPAPPLLYRTASDHDHARDLFAEHRDVARLLHGELVAFLRGHEAPPEAIERLSADNAGIA